MAHEDTHFPLHYVQLPLSPRMVTGRMHTLIYFHMQVTCIVKYHRAAASWVKEKKQGNLLRFEDFCENAETY